MKGFRERLTTFFFGIGHGLEQKNCSLHPKFGVRSKVWPPNFLFVDCGLKFEVLNSKFGIEF